MNRILDMNRFGRYLTTDIRSCAANYGLSFMLISLMGVIIYIGTILMGLIFNGTWEGPSLGFRATTFAICMFVLMVTMPAKCYGKITRKQEGSDWLMVPVSKMEKYVSMVIITIFIVPVASAGMYLGLDALMCAADSTCGSSIIGSIGNMIDIFLENAAATDSDMATFPALADFIRQVADPLLYVDDLIGISLIFLLGAIMFKTGKTVKTFIAIFIISTAVGSISAPIVSNIFGDLATNAQTDPEAFFSLGIFRHAALYDTINDTLINIALITGIYFRIKTLKH